jgi:hypothetical protein
MSTQLKDVIVVAADRASGAPGSHNLESRQLGNLLGEKRLLYLPCALQFLLLHLKLRGTKIYRALQFGIAPPKLLLCGLVKKNQHAGNKCDENWKFPACSE